MQSWLTAHCNLRPLSASDSPASASQVAGIAGLIFVYLVEMGFCHVSQARLELQTSSDLPGLGLPKCWDYRCELLCPTIFCLFFYLVVCLLFKLILYVLHVSLPFYSLHFHSCNGISCCTGQKYLILIQSNLSISSLWMVLYFV